ncbi:hypothetical protein CEXT_670521 [Caerostris extrusa]|uniref:Uncharacterized protein n=1 Tax=Caerostris extrusa TaxID=172846 RepID=A0AAV4PIP9_CAEEX|nr:hypothetical protein CEXT_670521 [Caerostris extrusa]
MTTKLLVYQVEKSLFLCGRGDEAARDVAPFTPWEFLHVSHATCQVTLPIRMNMIATFGLSLPFFPSILAKLNSISEDKKPSPSRLSTGVLPVRYLVSAMNDTVRGLQHLCCHRIQLFPSFCMVSTTATTTRVTT